MFILEEKRLVELTPGWDWTQTVPKDLDCLLN